MSASAAVSSSRLHSMSSHVLCWSVSSWVAFAGKVRQRERGCGAGLSFVRTVCQRACRTAARRSAPAPMASTTAETPLSPRH
eukprot:scaffold161896_cov30-Tisochrysis_lutea.AAC.1